MGTFGILNSSGGLARTTASLPANAVVLVEGMYQSNGGGTSSYSTDWDIDTNVYAGLEEDCFIWDRVARPERFTKQSVSPVACQWRGLTLGYGGSPLSGPPWVDPNPTSIGIELGLVKVVRAFFNRPVLFVKVFQGGIPIYDEGPSGTDWNSRSGPKDGSMWELWRDTYHDLAMADIASSTPFAGRPIYHVGVNYFQGAADSNVLAKANAYQTNLSNLIDDTRAHLGIDASFAIGRSEDYCAPGGGFINSHIYIGTVRGAQETLGATKPECVWYSTDRIEVDGGLEHFTGEGQRHSGYRAGAAIATLDNPILYIAAA